MTRVVLACIAVALVSSGVARGDDAKAAAQQHVDAATTLHQQRRWKESLDELMQAYSLDPRPEILYAIGQLHVALGQCAQAITYYERFIATKPSPAREAMANKAIAICKTNPPPPEPGPEATHEPAPQPAPAPVPEPRPVVEPVVEPVARPWYRDAVGDALVGSGAVAGVVAALYYASARSDLDAADRAGTYPEQASEYDQARTARTIAVVAAVAGGTLIAAGIVRYVVHDRRRESPALAIVPSERGGLLAWSGWF
ncbi:MAG TPA: hypothetical protein VMJ10_18820 [Kofleriaceae bacterium]|nr:hypothetical protein [Kofleriaceae bacterium]